MKIFYSLVLLGCFLQASAQVQIPFNEEGGKYQYQEVITTEGTPEEIYNRARQWFATYYQDSKEVLQFEDKESGKLSGNGSASRMIRGSESFLSYQISIDTKDGKYRYTITNFTFPDYATPTPEALFQKFAFKKDGTLKPWYQNYHDLIHENITALIANLKKSMETKPKEDDW